MKNLSISRSGRDIIDDVVVSNSSKNTEAYDNAKDIPYYYGPVKVVFPKLTLSHVTNKKKIVPNLLIQDIINGVNNFKLDDGESYLLWCEDGRTEKVPVNPEILKLLKVCIAASYNPCQEYSDVLSEFVELVLSCKGSIPTPLDLTKDTKLKKVIAEELELYVDSLLSRPSKIDVKGNPFNKMNKAVLGVYDE